MTDDDICALAVDFDAMSGDVGDLIKFARAIAAKEREACAELCEVQASVVVTNAKDSYQEGRSMGATVCAAAIRARGE